MKKITLLILLMTASFSGFSQNLANNPTFAGTSNWTDANAGTGQGIVASDTHTADGSDSYKIVSNGSFNSQIRNSNMGVLTAGDYVFSYWVKGISGVKSKHQIRDNGTNENGTNYTIVTTDTWEYVEETFSVSGGGQVSLRLFVNSNVLGNEIQVDDVSFTYVPPVSATYNSFVQNPDFEDVTGSVAPWSIRSGDPATATFSSDANVGVQAARVDITGTATIFLENSYTAIFDTPQTVIVGDEVTITFDMKSNNTALEVSGRFALDATTQFTGKKSVAVADTYESFSITKSIDGLAGNTYANINTLSFRIQSSSVSDYVIFDNVTTTVNIAGSLDVLTVESIAIDDVSVTLYPNPVNDVLNINSPLAIEKVEVFNLLGQKAMTTTTARINTSELAKGMYIIKITQENDVISTKRFIKQ